MLYEVNDGAYADVWRDDEAVAHKHIATRTNYKLHCVEYSEAIYFG